MTDTSGARPEYPPASRRTRFAEERTVLAWWRTGMAAAAVALAIGGLLPKLGDLPKDRFVALGIGYGILSLIFIIGGATREMASRRALEQNSHADLSQWLVIAVALYMSVLVILTVIALV